MTDEQAKQVAEELRTFAEPMIPPADLNAFLLKMYDDNQELKKQLRWLIWVTQGMTMDEAKKAMGS